MNLSADRINEISPYWVIPLDEKSFRIRTDYGVVYRIGFYEDTFLAMSDAYHFYIGNANQKHAPNDPKLLQTVTAIIEEFFRQNPLVMLYICDPRDHRQAARNRLYQQWFDNYIHNSDFRLYSESVEFESVDYYAGLIMRKDNPFYDDIINRFHESVRDLPEQMVGNKE